MRYSYSILVIITILCFMNYYSPYPFMFHAFAIFEKLLFLLKMTWINLSQLLAIAGAPYDTLEEVIGKRDSGGFGSLKDFGVEYREVPVSCICMLDIRSIWLNFSEFENNKHYLDISQLAEDGGLDWDALKTSIRPHTKCALIQRSCGYSWRRSLSVTEIGRAIDIIKVNLLKPRPWW